MSDRHSCISFPHTHTAAVFLCLQTQLLARRRGGALKAPQAKKGRKLSLEEEDEEEEENEEEVSWSRVDGVCVSQELKYL